MVRRISEWLGASFVVLDEVEGRGEVRLKLVSPSLLLFPTPKAGELAERMLQFEWGDFFFFRSRQDALGISPDDSLPTRVNKSLVTIRCVDNTYFYFYGTDLEIQKILQDRLEIDEEKEGGLENLDYPF
ncbi:MAG: hypothetical protein DWQ01_09145 [Planctomycetota bacterium]|nr:MAG: hypothetical protein DWQ01_09145 [Planctomycetota bacterium]